MANDPRFQTPAGRVEFIDEVDGVVANWISQHNLNDVLEKFEEVEAAVGPVYNIAQIFEDPQYIARNDIIDLNDEDLGKIKMTADFRSCLKLLLKSDTQVQVRENIMRKFIVRN